jgi:hypothetical protein
VKDFFTCSSYHRVFVYFFSVYQEFLALYLLDQILETCQFSLLVISLGFSVCLRLHYSMLVPGGYRTRPGSNTCELFVLNGLGYPVCDNSFVPKISFVKVESSYSAFHLVP